MGANRKELLVAARQRGKWLNAIRPERPSLTDRGVDPGVPSGRYDEPPQPWKWRAPPPKYDTAQQFLQAHYGAMADMTCAELQATYSLAQATLKYLFSAALAAACTKQAIMAPAAHTLIKLAAGCKPSCSSVPCALAALEAEFGLGCAGAEYPAGCVAAKLKAAAQAGVQVCGSAVPTTIAKDLDFCLKLANVDATWAGLNSKSAQPAMVHALLSLKPHGSLSDDLANDAYWKLRKALAFGLLRNCPWAAEVLNSETIAPMDPTDFWAVTKVGATTNYWPTACGFVLAELAVNSDTAQLVEAQWQGTCVTKAP